MFEHWVSEAGIGLLVAYLVIKEALGLVKRYNNRNDSLHYVTLAQHELICPRAELREKIDKIYAIVLEIKGRIDRGKER